MNKRAQFLRKDWQDTVETKRNCERLIELNHWNTEHEQEFVTKTLEHANNQLAMLEDKIQRLTDDEIEYILGESV